MKNLVCIATKKEWYGSCLLSAINNAIPLYIVVAIGPIPPAVENTNVYALDYDRVVVFLSTLSCIFLRCLL